VGGEAAEGSRGEPSCGKSVGAAELVEQVFGEQRQVFEALPKGRHVGPHDREPVVEVAAESSCGDEAREIPIRGGHDPNVREDVCPSAEGADSPVLEHPEQLRLERGRHVADLVEEQGSPVGELEEAGPVPVGSRVGAADRAEHLALEEGFGHGGAVDGEERTVAPAARLVDPPGEELFSGSGLSDQEHGQAGSSCSLQELEKLEQPPRPADELHRAPAGLPRGFGLRGAILQAAEQSEQAGMSFEGGEGLRRIELRAKAAVQHERRLEGERNRNGHGEDRAELEAPHGPSRAEVPVRLDIEQGEGPAPAERFPKHPRAGQTGTVGPGGKGRPDLVRAPGGSSLPGRDEKGALGAGHLHRRAKHLLDRALDASGTCRAIASFEPSSAATAARRV